MFSFFHPRQVVDGRAVAVKIVQQKVSAQKYARTLIVGGKNTAAPKLAANDEASENNARPLGGDSGRYGKSALGQEQTLM